jgi:hypothetical protein
LPNGSVAQPSAGRRPPRRFVTVVVVILVLALLAGGGVAVFSGGSTTVPPKASTPASPAARQLLHSALQAAGQVNAFHYVSVSSLSGPQGGTQRTVGDAGPNSGRQNITAGKQKFTVLVIGASCYLKGNAAALVGNLGFSTLLAQAHAGQWISLAPTDGPYGAVYAAVTAHEAIVDNIAVIPQSQLATSTVSGKRVETVSGTIAPVTIAGQTTPTPKGTASLSVRARAPHLPVRYRERGTLNRQQSTSTVSFSRWGESVTVTAPAGAVPFASVGGGPSSPTTPSGPILT